MKENVGLFSPTSFLNIYQKLYYMARNCGFLPQLIEYNFVKWAGKWEWTKWDAVQHFLWHGEQGHDRAGRPASQNPPPHLAPKQEWQLELWPSEEEKGGGKSNFLREKKKKKDSS